MKEKKQSRVGEVRCPNCFARFRPSPGAERASCPKCSLEWYISWKDTLAKIRKPVWESWERGIADIQHTKE